ncbi:MAG: Gldg family protein [Spirochaetia bacterium]
MRKLSRYKLLYFAVLPLAFIAVGTLGSQVRGRIDLTTGQLYTISPPARERLLDLDEPVSISYFLSPRLESYSAEPERIREYLEEFAATSPLVELRVLDASEPEHRDTALELGLQPQQLTDSDSESQSIISVFSGVVVQYDESRRVLPFVLDSEAFEYELISSWDEMIAERTPEIVVMSGNDELELRSAYQNALLRLSERFTVRLLEQGDELPPTADMLFLFGNKDLRTVTVLQIEDFLAAGGGVMLSVEGVHVQLDDELSARELNRSDLDLLLERYGVRVSRELVVDRYHMLVPLAGAGGNPESFVSYPHWIELLSRNAAPGHALTEAVTGLDLFWPSRIEPVGDAPSELNLTQLYTTSYEGRVMDSPFATNPALGDDIYDRVWREGGDRIGVVMTLSGRFPPAPGATAELTTERGRLLLVGGGYTFSDFLELGEDPMRNLRFLTAAGHWLASEEDLLALLGRSSRDLRLTGIASSNVRAAVVNLAQWVNIVAIPVAVLLFGAVRIIRRRRFKGVDAASL